MKMRTAMLAALATFTLAIPAQAAMIYSTQASYLAAINAGTAFTNTFDTSAGAPNYSNGTYAYTLTTTPNNSLYFSGGGVSGAFVGVNFPGDSLIVTFTSGNVSAVGGNFFLTNVSDVFQAAPPYMLTLSDGTVDVFSPTGINSFRGYTTSSGVFITSVTIAGWDGTGTATYAGFDNLIVGAALAPAAEAVPVPATVLLGFAAMPVIGFIRRKRA